MMIQTTYARRGVAVIRFKGSLISLVISANSSIAAHKKTSTTSIEIIDVALRVSNLL